MSRFTQHQVIGYWLEVIDTSDKLSPKTSHLEPVTGGHHA